MTKDAFNLSAECNALASGMAYTLRELAQESAILSEHKIVDALFGLAVTAEIIAEKSSVLMDDAFSVEEA